MIYLYILDFNIYQHTNQTQQGNQMGKFTKIFLLSAIPLLCFSQQDMNKLLSLYKSQAELSSITKSESAGFVDIYTREDIEKMQANTLGDILKLFTIPNVSRTSTNITFYTKPSNKSMPAYSIRLYINDHDFSTSSYGSDAVLWSSMTLDNIDHIVVYKSTSSVEFGNEPSTVVIKLYTKKAEKEEGGKIKLSADQKGSYRAGTYFAHTTMNNFSYFFYANKNDINRKDYYNQGYKLDSDTDSKNLYANFFYKNWRFEVGHYSQNMGSFLGLGKEAKPYGRGLYTKHNFWHITKQFENDIKLQFSYDCTTYDFNNKDNSGINAGSIGDVTNYDLLYDDTVVSAIVEKIFKTDRNKLLLGAFVKLKDSKTDGMFDTTKTDYKNRLNLYSLYAENSFSFNYTTMLVASLKGDFYRYDKVVEPQDEYIARIGIIKNINKFQLKAFYTKTYYTIPMTYLYSTNDTPYITNPDLNYTKPTLITLGIRYKDNKHEVDARAAFVSVTDKLIYKEEGFTSMSKSYDQYEVKYTYKINHANKISLDLYTGKNSLDLEFTPRYGSNIIAINTFGKFDLFNQISYKSSYSAYDVDVKSSYDYNFALKYHVNPDFAVGIKGENIFNSGYEQAYKSLGDSIPVYDRKFWVNMEYLF